MRKLLLLGLFALGVVGRAEDFTAIMTPEERAATGIDRLSPEELAKLKAVIERYKSGEVAVVRQEAAKKVGAAEEKARAAEAKAAAAPADDKKPGWLKALITLKQVEAKPDEAQAIESKLQGRLQGFSGKRNFTLENGQVWQMVDAGSYSGPDLDAPALSIKPGVLGVYWLRIPEAALRIKVKPLKLE